MNKWTEEQQNAIALTGCDLLVSAAAGSGKTAVLTERIVQKVLDPNLNADIDRFLIVTFTNAAAAEMRERICAKLTQRLEADPSDVRLQRQLMLIGKASITTIHSFCLDIIRNNFHLLDLDPTFRIADGTETELLKLQAAEDSAELLYLGEQGEVFTALSYWFGTARSDAGLIEKIIAIYDYLQSLPKPYAWLSRQIEKYNIPHNTPLDNLDWIDEIKKSYRTRLDGLIDSLSELIKRSALFSLDGYTSTFSDDLNGAERLQLACGGTWIELYEAACSFEFSKLGRLPKDADPDTREQCKKKRDAIKKSIGVVLEEIMLLSPDAIIEGLRLAYPKLLCLQQAVLEFDKRYTALKKEKKLLDFSDFEHLAIRLLSQEMPDGSTAPSPVARELQDKYVEIFIDEYQDCNEVQEELFGLICRREKNVCNNMFMVGDMKQSIYRFRQADPYIFRFKNTSYSDIDGLQRKIALSRNFRSRTEVLDFVNHVFRRIMNEYIGDITYQGIEELNAGAVYPPCEELSGGKVELLIAQPTAADHTTQTPEEDFVNDTPESEDEPLTDIALEARLVANRIKELINSGYMVYDKSAEQYRIVEYRDIVILMRSLSNRAECFEQELELRGIPYYTDRGSGFFMSLEIRVFISLLKLIDNPLQDVALLSVLRSPFGGFDDNMLLIIRQYSRQGAFFSAMQEAAIDTGEIADKCRSFLNKLENWRTLKIALPTDKLIWQLFDQTGYYTLVGAMPGGEQRQANLRMLFEWAKKYEKTNFRGLFNFINYINKVKARSDTGGAATLSEGSNVIRLMSIHKSKGLEFPVVFVSGITKKFNTQDSKGTLLMHKRLGLGVNLIDIDKRIKYKLISKLALTERTRLENLSEEMRVLYVALTRAKEKLILTGTVKKANEKYKDWQQLCELKTALPIYHTYCAKSYMDWLSGCLYTPSLDFNIKTTEQIQAEYTIEGSAMEVTAVLPINTQNALDPEVVRRLEYTYPHKQAVLIPAKLSVTELKRKFDPSQDSIGTKPYIPELLSRPRFMDSIKGITATQRGSAYHLVLRHLELTVTADSLQQTVDNLLAKQFLTEQEAKAIDITQLATFISTPIWQRMKSAKRLYRELAFNINLSAQELYNLPELSGETVMLQGIIDCLFEEEDGVVLVDYKLEGGFENTDKLKERYENQLSLYKIAAQKITGKPVFEVYLYLLNRGELLCC